MNPRPLHPQMLCEHRLLAQESINYNALAKVNTKEADMQTALFLQISVVFMALVECCGVAVGIMQT